MSIEGKKGSMYLSNRLVKLICIVAVLVLIPTGFAYWTDKLQVVNSFTTGYCDLAFTSAEVIDAGKNDDVSIQKQNEHDKHNHDVDAGNRLHIHIKDAEPNKIKFTVTNFGTAPAIFNTKTKVNQPVEIQFTNFTPKVDGDTDDIIVIPPKSSRTGEIVLSYTAEAEKNYNLLIDLKCITSNKYAIEASKE